MQWGQNRRPLVRPRGDPAHQLLGTPGRILHNQSLCQTQEQDPDLTADGQQHSSSLCEQNEGYTITEFVPPGWSPVAMVPAKGNSSVCRAPSRSCEHDSRSGVLVDRDLDRMDAAQGSFPLDSADSGPLPDGFVCDQVEPSTRRLCQLTRMKLWLFTHLLL